MTSMMAQTTSTQLKEAQLKMMICFLFSPLMALSSTATKNQTVGCTFGLF